MTEPRARAARQKGQLNFENELRAFLYAYGDDVDPLPETVRILDEIVTDFLIETCHQAARAASYSNRQKVKVDDFKFAIRKDPKMLGRVVELLNMDKELKEARKQFDLAEGRLGLEKSKAAKDGLEAKEPKPRGKKRKKVEQAAISEDEDRA